MCPGGSQASQNKFSSCLATPPACPLTRHQVSSAPVLHLPSPPSCRPPLRLFCAVLAAVSLSVLLTYPFLSTLRAHADPRRSLQVQWEFVMGFQQEDGEGEKVCMCACARACVCVFACVRRVLACQTPCSVSCQWVSVCSPRGKMQVSPLSQSALQSLVLRKAILRGYLKSIYNKSTAPICCLNIRPLVEAIVAITHLV